MAIFSYFVYMISIHFHLAIFSYFVMINMHLYWYILVISCKHFWKFIVIQFPDELSFRSRIILFVIEKFSLMCWLSFIQRFFICISRQSPNFEILRHCKKTIEFFLRN